MLHLLISLVSVCVIQTTIKTQLKLASALLVLKLVLNVPDLTLISARYAMEMLVCQRRPHVFVIRGITKTLPTLLIVWNVTVLVKPVSTRVVLVPVAMSMRHWMSTNARAMMVITTMCQQVFVKSAFPTADIAAIVTLRTNAQIVSTPNSFRQTGHASAGWTFIKTL